MSPTARQVLMTHTAAGDVTLGLSDGTPGSNANKTASSDLETGNGSQERVLSWRIYTILLIHREKVRALEAQKKRAGVKA